METTLSPTITDVLAFIGQQACEADITFIHSACNERSRSLRNIAALTTQASLAVGDTVRLVNLSPKYAVGVTGIVKSIGQRISVDIAVGAPDHNRSRTIDRYGSVIKVKGSMVEKVG